jgi:hypothetical protein
MAAAGSLKARMDEFVRLHPSYANRPRSELRRIVQTRQNAGTIWAGKAAEERVQEAGDALAREYERKRVKRADKKTQIELYHPRSIDLAQKNAAEKLKSDWQNSGLNPRVVAAYDSAVGGGGNNMPGMGTTARDYMLAMQAVGMILSPVLVHVVIEDQSAESWAQLKGKPLKDGIAALRLALDALCEHYRFVDKRRA